MDFSAIIYAGLGGGVGGLIAASITALIERRQSAQEDTNKNNDAAKGALRGGLAALFVVGGFTTTSALYKNMTLPRIVPMDVAEMIEDLPYLRYIEEQDPVAFEKLIYPIDKISRSGKNTQESVTEFRAQLQKIVSEKQATASAETLRVQNEVASELFDTLKLKAPQVCTQKFYGRPFQLLNEILDDDYSKRENAAMGLYFTNPPRPETYTPDLVRGEELFNEIFLRLVEELEIEDLDPPIDDDPTTLVQHIKICNIQSKLNHASNALSDDDFLHVVSYIASVE